MARYLVKGSITSDREYLAGEVIELSDEQAVQLLEIEKVEKIAEEKKSPAPSEKTPSKSGR